MNAGDCIPRGKPGTRRARLIPDFDKFQPVSPGIFRIESALAGQIVVIQRGHSAAGQGFTQLIQIDHSKRGVSLPCGPEIPFNADMQLVRAALEPATAARAQHGGLLDFPQAKNYTVKFPGCCFTSFGCRDLDVIEASDSHTHDSHNITGRGLHKVAPGKLLNQAGSSPGAVASANCGGPEAGAKLLQ